MNAQLDFHVASTHWFQVLNQIIWIQNPHLGFKVEVQILPTKSSIKAQFVFYEFEFKIYLFSMIYYGLT
jgi:hypothetical protein